MSDLHYVHVFFGFVNSPFDLLNEQKRKPKTATTTTTATISTFPPQQQLKKQQKTQLQHRVI